MTPIRLHPYLAGIRAILFDLDGVLYEEQTAVPRAPETVAVIRAAGLPLRFLGLVLDVGPFLAALECATGRSALVFGKPAVSPVMR